MNRHNHIKLSNVCLRITDGSHYSPMGVEEGYPMLSVKDMLHHGFSYQDCKYISEEEYNNMLRNDCVPLINDVLIAKDGSYLKHVFVIKEEKKQAILSSIGILRPDLNKITPDYLKYYLHSNSVKETVSKKYVSGSALPRIILKNFGEIEIIIKPISEQQKIAKVLSDLDAKIEINNKINAELEAMAKTIYDYWFVQFDFPDEEGKPYKSSGGIMVWNAKLKREIPEGWESNKLGNVLKTYLGGTPSTKIQKYWDGNIPWMNSGEVINFPLISTEQYITEEAIKKSSTRFLKKGSVILSITRHLRVNILAIDSCINQSIAGIEENEKLKKSYIYFSVLNDIDRLMNLRTGAQQPHINKEIVDSSQLLLPNDEILKSFYKIVNPIFEQIINNAFQNQYLASLRDWLLPMLMNGQVTVGEVCKEYVEKKDVLGMVAEPNPLFENDLNIDDLNASIAAIYYIENKKNGYAHAKTGFHKTLFFAKTAMKQSILKNLQFQRYLHGTFSKQVANAIENNPFLKTERVSRKLEIFKLKEEKNLQLKEWMDKKENKSFVKSIEQLVDLYQDPIISNDIDKIELMNTVYKIMLDINSTDFNKIWKEMKVWPINKDGSLFKSDKFTTEETKDMIKFILRIGWYN